MSMIKKVTVGLFACAIAALPLAASAQEAAEAEGAEVSASADVAILSAYVWRGQVLNDEAVVQPTFTIEKGGLALNWWGNLNLTDQATGDEHEFSEHDVSISYSFDCPVTGAGVTLGLVNYDFPNVVVDDTAAGSDALVRDTHEVQLTVDFGDVLLAPSVLISYDFKEVDGFYGSVSVGHSIALAETVSLDAGVSVGYADSDYNAFYFGVDDDALNDVTVSLSLPIATCPNWTITPGVQYVMLPDSDIEDGADATYGEKDHVVGSLTASYVF